MKTYKIAVLPGDGIGPEVIDAAVKVLKAVEEKSKTYKLNLVWGEAGFNCIAKYGTNVPPQTVDMLKTTAACLKGPMTTPEEAGAPPSAALTIRKLFNLYANVRPCFSLPNVPSLKPNIDLIIVRENTEGMYSNIEFELEEGLAVAMRVISRKASERVARFAFKLADQRKRHLSYAHKANILRRTDGVFNQAVLDVAKEFPGVRVDDFHIDAMAMELIKNPGNFDVVVTTNLFGDIISDEAAELVGGLGVAAGANIGENYGMFEPVHGSAPKLSGQNKVDPIAAIFAGKMLLDYLGEKDSALIVERAVSQVLRDGKVLTYDLGGKAKTSDLAEEIVGKIGNVKRNPK
jgi:isopropylmalate/isohomocitrate dehydrogenase-like protein